MKFNILYIEDYPDNMTLVRRIIHASNYTLMAAGTGLQGLLMAETEDVDLILIDINLPDIDGYDLAMRLRSSSKLKLRRIPIIAVTANALKGDAIRALEAGCDAYLSKPIDIQDLLQKIEIYKSLSN
jgi:two-component system cell cycle response regulator DivK